MKKTSKKIMSVYDKMKLEVAAEMGIELGPKASAYDNGKVGGEITRRLIAQAKAAMIEA